MYNDLISSFHSLLCRRLFWGELLYVNLLVIQEITSHFCLSQDVLSYRAVGISVSRIFTINHRVRSGTWSAFLYLSWYLDFYSQLWPKALSRQTSSWWKTNNAGEKASVDWLNLACSRLRDGGGKSFSNTKCEKRAGAGHFSGRHRPLSQVVPVLFSLCSF